MAICFEVSINGQPPLLAGAEGIAVLSAILSYVAKAGELELALGGLLDGSDGPADHLSWLRDNLSVGDQITIRIVEASTPAQPVERVPQHALFAEEKEREYYEHLRRKYEPKQP